MSKLRYFVLLLSVIVQLQGFAQDVSLKTTVQDVRVCGDAVVFSVDLKNLGGSQWEEVQVFSKLPNGVSPIADSFTHPLDASSTDGLLVFNVGTVPNGGQTTISFSVDAQCDLIDYITEYNTNAKIANVATSVSYSDRNVLKTYEEREGSVSFNVFYPSLLIEMKENDIEKNILAGETTARTFTITNGGDSYVGNEGFKVAIDHSDNATETISISNGGGSSYAVEEVSNRYIITIDDFTAFGDGDGKFEPGESLELTEDVRINTCSVSSTNFTVLWGCKDNVCNENANNATATANITSTSGVPAINNYVQYSSINYCDDPITLAYVIENKRPKQNARLDGANRAIIKEIEFIKNDESRGDLSYKVKKKDGTYTEILPSRENSNAVYFSAQSFNNEIEGISDIDGDGSYSDLLPGEKITLQIELSMSCIAAYSDFSVNKSSLKVEPLRALARWESVCGVSDYRYAFINRTNTFVSQKIDGPIDLLPEETGTYSFSVERQVSEWNYKCEAGHFSSIIKLPSSAYKVDVNNVRWGNSLVPATQNSDGTLVIEGGGWKGEYQIDVTLDCTGSSNLSAASFIKWDMYYDCSGANCCKQHIASSQYEVFNHCPSSGSECVRTTSFIAERTTLGYPENEQGFYTSLPDQLTETDDGMRLDAAMEGDQVKLVAEGIVSSGNYSELKVEIQYSSPYNEELLQFIDGQFEISGKTYPVLSQPVRRSSAEEGQIVYYYTFSVEGYNDEFSGDLQVDLSANFRVKEILSDAFKAGEFRLNRFRATHYGVKSNGNEISCESFGAKLNITRAYFSHQVIRGNNRVSPSCTGFRLSLQFNPYGVNGDPFPNEFRPTNKIHGISINIPDGYEHYDSYSQIRYYNRRTGRQTAVHLGVPTVETLTDGTQRLTFTSTMEGEPLPSFEANNANGLIYLDVGLSSLCYNSLYNSRTNLSVTYTKRNLGEVTYSPPFNIDPPYWRDIKIEGATVKDGYKDEISWNVSLSGGSINSLWLTIEPPQNITITSVVREGSEYDLLTYDDLHPERKWIRIGRMGWSETIPLTIIAKYNDCIQDVIDDIKITANYACDGFPESPYDETDCTIGTRPASDVLQIRYKNADLQASFNKINETVNLCEPIPFEVSLLSSGLGEMYDLHVITEIPVGMILVPGSGEYNRNGTWQPLGEAASISHNGINGTGWNLSSSVLGGEGFAGGEEMKIRFSLEAGCDQAPGSNFDPGVPVLLYATGRTNCNDDIVLPFQEKVNINGFDLTGRELIPSIATEAICAASPESLLNVSVYNPNDVASGNQELLVQLTPEIKYESVTPGSPVPTSVTENEEGTIIVWSLAGGIGPKATIKNHQIVISVTDPIVSSVALETRTHVFGSAICVSNQQSCPLTGTTGFNQRDVAVEQEGCDTSCPEATINANLQCAGKLTSFEAVFSQDISRSLIVWNFGDGTTSQDLQPTHTYVKEGVYDVTLSIDGPFSCQAVIQKRIFVEACYDCVECIPSFSPIPGRQYVLSAWVKEEAEVGTVNYEQTGVSLVFRNAGELVTLRPSGAIIDGWQRIEEVFLVPETASAITVNLVNEGSGEAYFDDIRIHPLNANMKSFVYDPVSMRLMAELDENNYATFYEYDEEGALIRVKKETERGIKTIQESRNHTVKKK